jgi:P-type Mg2+ transporter
MSEITVAPPEKPVPEGLGLTTLEAKAQLAKFGPNEQAPPKRAAGLIQVLLLFANPLVIILLIASAVSAFVGEIVNATIIALMVVVSIVINFYQTWHSQRAAERLRGQVASKATLLRDGKWTELPRREVVPGDIFRLSAGDLAPALQGVHTAYYLIHSMGAAGDFEAEDRRAAQNFGAAARAAGVRRIIYLGGLGEGARAVSASAQPPGSRPATACVGHSGA